MIGTGRPSAPPQGGLAVSGDERPLELASRHFRTMLELARRMMLEADAAFWDKDLTPGERTALYEKDARLNKLQRRVRKAVIESLSGSAPSDVPHGLLLMSLVKDIERLGDYAKNLAEVATRAHARGARVLPDDGITRELKQISEAVVRLSREAPAVYEGGHRERAHELTVEGRSTAKRCDQLLIHVRQSDYGAALAVDITLAARFYKRLQGHLLNLLSSVLMPLHKLDYYDEGSLRKR